MVEAAFEHGAAAAANGLRQAGAELIGISRRYQVDTIAVRPEQLDRLGQVQGVRGIKEVLTPMLYGTGYSCPQGVSVSEGDEQLRAKAAREAFGVDGAGVTVGILSDSFNSASKEAYGTEPIATHAEQDVRSGDLPGVEDPCGNKSPMRVLEEFKPEAQGEEATDEGRAMAQIVHDLAPGAKLAFATAFNGPTAFAENIERLAAPTPSEGGSGAGADVIVDDVAYLNEPFFQEGPIGAAIKKVAHAGVTYFTAAGNDNVIEEPEAGVARDIASWEAPAFRNAGSCPAGVPAYAKECMNFAPEGTGESDTGFGITVKPEGSVTIDLQWAQPWEGVRTDLDAYLVKEGVEIAESAFPNTESSIQEPVEILSWTNPGAASAVVELVINRCESVCGAARAIARASEGFTGTSGGDNSAPALKISLVDGSEVESVEHGASEGKDEVGPTIYGHAASPSAITVGAVPYVYPFGSLPNYRAEPYSSRGPAKHYFGPVDGAVPAAALTETETILKPDVAATDCGATTFFAYYFSVEGEAPEWHFCGTSAAAPHAAAVAALMLQRDPELTPAQVRAGLAQTAWPEPNPEPEAVGSGLVNALMALEATPATTENEPPEEEVPVEEVTRATPPPTPNPAPTTSSHSGQGAPSTRLLRHPHKVIRVRGRRARVTLAFGSDQQGVTFLCKVDRGGWRKCPARFVHRFKLGRHVVQVKAVNGAGLADATPAVFRFVVKRRR